jgi:hypothetical protein
VASRQRCFATELKLALPHELDAVQLRKRAESFARSTGGSIRGRGRRGLEIEPTEHLGPAAGIRSPAVAAAFWASAVADQPCPVGRAVMVEPPEIGRFFSAP